MVQMSLLPEVQESTGSVRFVGKCPGCKTSAAKNGKDWMDWSHACRSCGRRFKLAQVQGYVTSAPCNAKCMGAVGPACDCSCGGANHGGRFL